MISIFFGRVFFFWVATQSYSGSKNLHGLNQSADMRKQQTACKVWSSVIVTRRCCLLVFADDAPVVAQLSGV